MNHDRDAEFYGLYRTPLQIPPPRRRLPPPLPEAEEPLESCQEAEAFASKMQDIIFAPLGQTPSPGAIAESEYILYKEWNWARRCLPVGHARIGPHRCVYQVFVECADRLIALAWQLRHLLHAIKTYDQLTKAPRRRRRQDQEPVARLYSLGVPLGELDQ